MPTQAGITSAQLNIVTSDIPGKAVCYTELAGFPLTALSSIESWRTSYRKELVQLPLHTHIDVTQFSHPIAPGPAELNSLAEDFKTFLLSVMTGVLSRSRQRGVPAGQYDIELSKGDCRRVGNERSIRQNGLVLQFREAIISQVEELLNNADGYVLVALSALASYYETQVYTPKFVSDDIGLEYMITGFACTIAKELSYDLSNKARKEGLTEVQIKEITEKLLESNNLKEWAKPIPDSNLDAYETEVCEADEIAGSRLKYVINPELLNLGESSQFIKQFFTAEPIQKNSAVLPPPLPLDLPSSTNTSALHSIDRVAILDSIKNASGLKDEGILSQVEFDTLKAELLKKLIS